MYSALGMAAIWMSRRLVRQKFTDVSEGAVRMETANTSETSVNLYQTTRPADHTISPKTEP
jgi:hypothetical protein